MIETDPRRKARGLLILYCTDRESERIHRRWTTPCTGISMRGPGLTARLITSVPLRPVGFSLVCTAINQRCTLQVSFTALLPFLLGLTSLRSGVQQVLFSCGLPCSPPTLATYQALFTNAPTERLIQESSASTFSASTLYTAIPGERLGTTNIPPPPATAYSLTRGSKSVSPMVSHTHIKRPLSSRIFRLAVGYHHHHHPFLLCDLRSSTAQNNPHIIPSPFSARPDTLLPTARLPLSHLDLILIGISRASSIFRQLTVLTDTIQSPCAVSFVGSTLAGR